MQASSSGSASVPNTMTSSELLARMRQRNNGISRTEADADDPAPVVDVTNMDPANVELMTDIRNHISFGCSIDGQASTQELLDHFSARIPQSETVMFKAMLRQICDFCKRDGVGIWRLKSEFR